MRPEPKSKFWVSVSAAHTMPAGIAVAPFRYSIETVPVEVSNALSKYMYSSRGTEAVFWSIATSTVSPFFKKRLKAALVLSGLPQAIFTNSLADVLAADTEPPKVYSEPSIFLGLRMRAICDYSSIP